MTRYRFLSLSLLASATALPLKSAAEVPVAPTKGDPAEPPEQPVEPEAGFTLSLAAWTAFATTAHESCGGQAPLEILSHDPAKFTDAGKAEFSRLVAEAKSSHAMTRGLVGLWLSENGSFSLEWWRLTSRFRYSRVTALAYMVCANFKGREDYPPVLAYANRFAEPERTERVGEVELVEGNVAEFGKVLHGFLAKNPSKLSKFDGLRQLLKRFG